jgi:hypothetical protein
MKKRLSINITHLGVEKPKQMTDANVLYNTYKGTLDFNFL